MFLGDAVSIMSDKEKRAGSDWVFGWLTSRNMHTPRPKAPAQRSQRRPTRTMSTIPIREQVHAPMLLIPAKSCDFRVEYPARVNMMGEYTVMVVIPVLQIKS